MDLCGIIKGERHPKGWGEEIWVANSSLYCGKILILRERKKCSIHYHLIKDETFLVEEGLVQIDVYPNVKFGTDKKDLSTVNIGKRKRWVMGPGDILHIYPGLPHQFFGLQNSRIFEFSTQHFEDDSYRVEKGD